MWNCELHRKFPWGGGTRATSWVSSGAHQADPEWKQQRTECVTVWASGNTYSGQRSIMCMCVGKKGQVQKRSPRKIVRDENVKLIESQR